MYRVFTLAGLSFAALALAGCAGSWDTLTSRQFRKHPLDTTYRMMNPEDPMVVLRADPPRDGDERARAVRRLKEPLANRQTQADQDEMVDLLARAATGDGSPVLRLAAIETLARFQDPRAAGVLVIAYQKAHGRPDGAADPLAPAPGVQLAAGVGGRVPGRTASVIPLTGPTGFPPDTAAAIRCRAAEALGRTNRPEAVRFLAAVAGGPTTDTAPDGADDRDVRLAAVRGLGRCRQPEAVAALAQVMTAEAGKDAAIVGRAHDGLVHLTGKKLPADPQEWNAVVQAGVTIAPEPTWTGNAVETAVGWVKK